MEKVDWKKYLFYLAIFIFITKPSLFFTLLPFVVIAYTVKSAIKSGNNGNKYTETKENWYQPSDARNFINNINFNKMETTIKKSTAIILLAVVGIIILIKSLVVVQAGETGVFHLFGKINDIELRSGLHFVNPLAEVTKMSVRTEQYTMSIAREEGNKGGDDSIDALTSEGLTIKLDITVFYHLIEDKASDVYRTLGTDWEEKIIRPEIRSAIREIVANYDSKAIYSDKRDEIILAIKDSMIKSVEPRGIVIEQVLLRNVILPARLDSSIQEKLQAEQESQRYEFLLSKEKQEAERKIIEAKGQRDAQQLINESLTNNYLNYLYIKELKDRQGTIYVPTSPTTGMPIFKDIK